jgi:hypothetical protein
MSLINNYSLFRLTNDEIIKLFPIKLGKENNEKILETLFYGRNNLSKISRNVLKLYKKKNKQANKTISIGA